MTSYLKIFGAIALIVIATACESKKPGTSEKEPVKEAWANQMQNLANTLAELIPYVSSQRNFNDPHNAKLIDSKVESLLNLSHKINEKQMAPDHDPTLQMVSDEFVDDLQRVKSALAQGHRDYAQYVLKSSTAYCVECHTRNNVGPTFVGMKINSVVSSLPLLERADFYAATRQFDRALDEFKEVIKTSEKFADWDRAARYSLAIAVRFMDDPNKALEITNLILDSANAPLYLKDDALAWKKSISEWHKEPQQKSPSSLAQIEGLIEKAKKLQRYPTDHSTDIYFLRASAKAHAALEKGLAGEEKSRALFIAGECYEYLRIPNFWSFQEKYYESCIQNSPHSPMAMRCFKKYESSLLSGYLGSSGFDLPMDVQSKLIELRGLAVPME